MLKVVFWEFLFVCLFSLTSISQQANTAMFILDIAPDARSGALAGAAVSTDPDVNSQKSNTAKYLFAEDRYGVSISYVPWLQQITDDMYLSFGSAYANIGKNQVIGASFTYFSHGSTTLTSDSEIIGSVNAGEYAIDLSYSRRLGRYLAAGISFRYINTLSLSTDAFSPIQSVSAFAGDVNLYYRRPVLGSSTFSLGASVSNIGTKVQFSEVQQLFLPMSLSLGATFGYKFLGENRISPSIEFIKSLVPISYEPSTTLFSAIGNSFSEIDNMTCIVGMEYSFRNMFFARGGYRKNYLYNTQSYYSMGGGLTYKFFSVDVAYLLSTQPTDNALNNTLYMTLSFQW